MSAKLVSIFAAVLLGGLAAVFFMRRQAADTQTRQQLESELRRSKSKEAFPAPPTSGHEPDEGDLRPSAPQRAKDRQKRKCQMQNGKWDKRSDLCVD